MIQTFVHTNSTINRLKYIESINTLICNTRSQHTNRFYLKQKKTLKEL